MQWTWYLTQMKATEEWLRIIRKVQGAILSASDMPQEKVEAQLVGVLAKWGLEAGALMPEPGEEAEWIARHHRRNLQIQY